MGMALSFTWKQVSVLGQRPNLSSITSGNKFQIFSSIQLLSYFPGGTTIYFLQNKLMGRPHKSNNSKPVHTEQICCVFLLQNLLLCNVIVHFFFPEMWYHYILSMKCSFSPVMPHAIFGVFLNIGFPILIHILVLIVELSQSVSSCNLTLNLFTFTYTDFHFLVLLLLFVEKTF